MSKFNRVDNETSRKLKYNGPCSKCKTNTDQRFVGSMGNENKYKCIKCKTMNIDNKQLMDFINSIAVVGKSKIPEDKGKVYYSKVDGSYITRVGMEESLKFLFDRGITEQIQDGHEIAKTACIGFNPVTQEWYGWSHRAIFGFGIGSKVKQGDCGFEPSTKEEFIEREISFWGDCEYAVNGAVDYTENDNGILITYVYNDEVPNEKLRGTLYEHFSEYPKKWGKGEWEAKTLEDAKQMAIDFAKSVS